MYKYLSYRKRRVMLKCWHRDMVQGWFYLRVGDDHAHDITQHVHSRLERVLNTSNNTAIRFRNLILCHQNKVNRTIIFHVISYLSKAQKKSWNRKGEKHWNRTKHYFSMMVFLTCICWITDKSNIHKPSRDVATPAISMYADKRWFWTHIEATHTRRQVHCLKCT